jgi:hypothetical protein
VLPLEEQIHTPILDQPEPQSLVEPQRGVEALDVDAERLGCRLCFGLKLADERRPDAAVAELGQQRDVDDTDFVRPAGNGEAQTCSSSARSRRKLVLGSVRLLQPFCIY